MKPNLENKTKEEKVEKDLKKMELTICARQIGDLVLLGEGLVAALGAVYYENPGLLFTGILTMGSFILFHNDLIYDINEYKNYKKKKELYK
jgi:hypothetical protein